MWLVTYGNSCYEKRFRWQTSNTKQCKYSIFYVQGMLHNVRNGNDLFHTVPGLGNAMWVVHSGFNEPIVKASADPSGRAV